MEDAAGGRASPTALTGTLALALTASFQRKSAAEAQWWIAVGERKWWQVRRTRISRAKLLSSPSSALTASKSNTNCAAKQQAQWQMV